MNFFEKELRRIVGVAYPDAVFVDRACYVRLNDMTRAKIEFITLDVANHYSAIRVTVLNKYDGQVDVLCLHFLSVLGKKQTGNPALGSISPHVWVCDGKERWCGCPPDDLDYLKLTNAIKSHLELFS